MNVLKHMELIFGAVLAGGCLIAALPDDISGPAKQQAAHADMPVVVVKAKRMTALEKRHSLDMEAATDRAGD